MNAFQYVATVNSSKITHALRSGWSYDGPRISVCGRSTTGVQSMHSGAVIEVTCKSCNRIMDKASDAGFQETRVTVQGAEPEEWVPDMSNVPRECFFGCSRLVVAAFSDMYGNTQGTCQDHADRLSLTYYPLPMGETLSVDTSEVMPGDLIVEAPDLGIIRDVVPHTDKSVMIFGELGQDWFATPQRVTVKREPMRQPEPDMPTVHEALGEPYVMEGRVMIAIPGLFREDGSPVELDEGTERFIITPGYTTQRDCAHMTSIKRYGRRNPNVRVTDLTYVGPLN